jgi:hypothetical protein
MCDQYIYIYMLLINRYIILAHLLAHTRTYSHILAHTRTSVAHLLAHLNIYA